MLKKQGVPDRLAYHIVSLFQRDPVPAYENELNFDALMPGSPCCSSGDELSTEEEKEDCVDWWTKVPPTCDVSHFENLQSTNWNSLRFKSLPSVDTDIGWRVEFRPLDI